MYIFYLLLQWKEKETTAVFPTMGSSRMVMGSIRPIRPTDDLRHPEMSLRHHWKKAFVDNAVFGREFPIALLSSLSLIPLRRLSCRDIAVKLVVVMAWQQQQHVGLTLQGGPLNKRKCEGAEIGGEREAESLDERMTNRSLLLLL